MGMSKIDETPSAPISEPAANPAAADATPESGRKGAGKAVWMGIGSAAIVAALLYANRKRG